MHDERREPPAALRAGDPMLGLGYAPPVLARRILRRGAQVADAAGEAIVAEEVPVAFVYNMRPHVVMMATPADLEDFAVGFTLAEQVVESAANIASLEVTLHGRGIELQLGIAEEAGRRLDARVRRLTGRSGCGLCGVETIEEALRPVTAVAAQPPVPVEALWRAEAALVEQQPLNRQTGSLHAAAWADRDGALRVVREDVGRHNALDKVLGALARAGTDPAQGFIVVTSRASYELVQKAAVAGVPLLAAVSRPTGLAVRLAEAAGITLVGLLRDGTASVYAHEQGLALGEQAAGAG